VVRSPQPVVRGPRFTIRGPQPLGPLGALIMD